MKWEAVLLLGSSEVVLAARNWHTSVSRLERIAYGKPSGISLQDIIDAISRVATGIL